MRQITNYSHLLGPLTILLTLVGCQQPASLETTDQACRDLVLDYAYYRDRTDLAMAAQGVAELFTDNATLTIRDNTFTGKQAIHDRIANQQQAPLTQHLMSTIRIVEQSATSATGVSYATVYIAPRTADGSPSRVKGFAGIGEYHDRFVRTPKGWRIAERKLVMRMVQADD